jgi:signal transduction histidine kinase
VNLSKLSIFSYMADSGPERFAVGRINTLLARIFSVGGLAVAAQMLLNAWAQKDLLYPWYFWPGFGLVAIGQIGMIYAAYFSGENSFWQRWYARSIEAVIVTWFIGVPYGTVFPDHFYPWAWWGVGLAVVAAFAGLPPKRAILFALVLDSYWFIARFFPAYGAIDLWLNFQDTLLTSLFSAMLASLILVTRHEASKVDDASARAIEAATEQARIDAKVREKTRLDALIHDKVLTTLLLAARATSPGERHAAAGLAISAITQLNDSSLGGADVPISSKSFLDALEQVARKQVPEIEIHRSVDHVFDLPGDVAAALTEAMLQAILNAHQHAGPKSVCQLRLRSRPNGVKIVVTDNGRGFRMSRVPKSRLGVRVSIIDRVELVGGRAYVDSKPGSGTNIILEWQVAP